MRKRSFVLVFFCLVFSCGTPSKVPSVKLQSVAFLDSLSLQTFSYFWDLAHPKNGQIPDRWPTKSFSSIAATGFGLTTYLVGVERGYISREKAATRVLTTLTFLNRAPKGNAAAGISGYKGFFYHFLDSAGLRFQRVELSTIDTGLLMAGVLSAQSFFDQQTPTEQHIGAVSDSLFLAVEWDWAMNGNDVMSMGWHPESGFIKAKWQGYTGLGSGLGDRREHGRLPRRERAVPPPGPVRRADRDLGAVPARPVRRRRRQRAGVPQQPAALPAQPRGPVVPRPARARRSSRSSSARARGRTRCSRTRARCATSSPRRASRRSSTSGATT